MFERELSAGLDRIAEVPRSGQPYRARRRLETRRVLLAKTRHHVYYTVDDARSVVIVLAVWHSARGKAPRL
jgi:plasmid stabilization system protein ParE